MPSTANRTIVPGIYTDMVKGRDTEQPALKIANFDDFYAQVARGKIPGHRLVHKFGAGTVESVNPRVVTSTGEYKVPMTATALEFVSDKTNDTTGGTGATKIMVIGLNADWERIEQEIDTNGTTAVPIPVPLTRLFRWYVSESGSYAASTTPSHLGDLTIRESGNGDDWDTISMTPLPLGQSTIGAYTVPKGETAYLLSKVIFVDSARVADLYFFQRPFADDVTTPHKGVRRIIESELGIQGGFTVTPISPKGSFAGPCDLGFIGLVNQTTAEVRVEFELLLIEDGY